MYGHTELLWGEWIISVKFSYDPYHQQHPTVVTMNLLNVIQNILVKTTYPRTSIEWKKENITDSIKLYGARMLWTKTQHSERSPPNASNSVISVFKIVVAASCKFLWSGPTRVPCESKRGFDSLNCISCTILMSGCLEGTTASHENHTMSPWRNHHKWLMPPKTSLNKSWPQM